MRGKYGVAATASACQSEHVSDSRFWDDLHLVPVDEYVPATVQALLRHLHAEFSERADQEARIRDWLATHPPGPMMTYSLRDSGFGHLLG